MQLLSELGLPFMKKNEADEKPKVENKPTDTEAVEETPEAAVEETPDAEVNEEKENKKEN